MQTIPHVVAFLREGGTLNDLLTSRGIVGKRHREHENLVLLKYNQIESPMVDPLVQECRGLVLDEADNWRVVSRAFDKFFNYGEGHAAPIDWSTAEVQEKVDGSMIAVYAYKGAWHAATTGTPDGCGDVHGNDASGSWSPRPGTSLPVPDSFAGYFWQTLSFYDVPLFNEAPKGAGECITWIFELTGPLNRVVIPHAEAKVTLLGARLTEGGKWIPLGDAKKILGGNVPAVRSFPLQTVDDILTSFATLSPLAQEGYVVCDAAFNRIKVKHPRYVALHHAKDGMSVRAFVDIAKTGETPEVIAVFPEMKPQLDDIRDRFNALVFATESDFDAYKRLTPKKDFALAIKHLPHSAALFQMYDGKAPSARAFYASRTADQLMPLLGLKADPA
jgi:hypothetical protein